jgi:hypothetical protein
MLAEELVFAVIGAATEPKLSVAGSSVTIGELVIGVFAKPLITRVCGESGASSLSVMVAERRPAASGRNVTEMRQLEFGAIGVLQFGAEKLKSAELAPDIATPEMRRGNPPEFVAETLDVTLVPTAISEEEEPKVRVPGTSVTAEDWGVPVPESATDWEAGEALLVIVSEAVRSPETAGEKTIIAVQN